MNFAIEHLGRAGERAGNLELKTKLFSTPFPLLTTKGGSVPHLTRETLAYLNLPETAVLLPYANHATQTDILQQYKKGRKLCFHSFSFLNRVLFLKITLKWESIEFIFQINLHNLEILKLTNFRL